VDGFGSRLSAGGSGLYQGLLYPCPTSPWDSGVGNLCSLMEALHHPSRTSPTEAMQYMSQHLMMGSMFHEGVWPPSGEGATLIDPILRSSSQVNLTGIVDSVMGPSREGSPTHGSNGGGGGSHLRNVSGNSQVPLLLPGVTSSLTPPSEPHMATRTRSSPLCASSGDHLPQEQDKLTRTKRGL
jgi:hypothetical protein